MKVEKKFKLSSKAAVFKSFIFQWVNDFNQFQNHLLDEILSANSEITLDTITNANNWKTNTQMCLRNAHKHTRYGQFVTIHFYEYASYNLSFPKQTIKKDMQYCRLRILSNKKLKEYNVGMDLLIITDVADSKIIGRYFFMRTTKYPNGVLII